MHPLLGCELGSERTYQTLYGTQRGPASGLIGHGFGRPGVSKRESDVVDTKAAIDRFLEHGGLSEASQRAYGSDLDAFAHWLSERALRLDEVDARVLSDWIADLGRGRRRLAPATVSRRVAAVRSCLRFTFGQSRVPDAAFTSRRPRRLPHAPKAAEVDELLELAEGHSPLALRNRALLELLY